MPRLPLSARLQLTQRNHAKVWRNSLTAWRGLLHQKFALLEVGVVLRKQSWVLFNTPGGLAPTAAAWAAGRGCAVRTLRVLSMSDSACPPLPPPPHTLRCAGCGNAADQHVKALRALLEGLGGQQGRLEVLPSSRNTAPGILQV